MSSNQLISARFIVILLLSVVCPAIFSCAGTVSPEPHKSNAIDVIDMAMAEEPSKSLEQAEAVSRSHEPVKAPNASTEPLKAASRLYEAGQVSSREPVRGVSDSPELAKTFGKPHEPVKAVRKSPEPEKPPSEPVSAVGKSPEQLKAPRKSGEPGNALSTSHTPAEELSTFAEEGSATANYLRKLAEAGDASAQNKLGLLYYDGKGVPQNYGQAKEWFEKAAKQGHVERPLDAASLNEQGTVERVSFGDTTKERCERLSLEIAVEWAHLGGD